VVTLHTHACWERACFTYLSDIWLFRLINQIIFEMPNWSAHLLFSNVILSILGKYCVIFFYLFFLQFCAPLVIYIYIHTHTHSTCQKFEGITISNLFLWFKATFSASLLQSSESQIILHVDLISQKKISILKLVYSSKNPEKKASQVI